MAELAVREAEGRAAASTHPDADTAAGEATGRAAALLEAAAALRAMVKR